MNLNGSAGAVARSAVWGGVLLSGLGCANLPEVRHERFAFPKENVFVEVPERPFEVLGRVKAEVTFPTLDEHSDEPGICKNYYNKAAQKLLAIAKKQAKADAVVELRSVTLLFDGRIERHKTPECVDEGGEGEVLVEGIAVRWKKPGDPQPKGSPSPVPSFEETPRLNAEGDSARSSGTADPSSSPSSTR